MKDHQAHEEYGEDSMNVSPFVPMQAQEFSGPMEIFARVPSPSVPMTEATVGNHPSNDDPGQGYPRQGHNAHESHDEVQPAP